MAREVIKDFYGRIIGSIETDMRGNAVGKDFYNRIVGSYDANLNKTKNFYGQIIGTGNQLVRLIYQAEDEKKR